MKPDNGGGMFGGMGQPGQREIIRPSRESEVWRPVSQWLVASLVAELAYGMLVLFAVMAGHGLAFWTALAILLVGGAVAGPRLCRTTEQLAAFGISVTAAVMLWAFFGWEISARAWPVLLGWRVLLSPVLLIPVAIAVFVVWRYMAEISNPNWPAPLEARPVWQGGVGWPWAQYRDPDAEDEPEQALRSVVRPVPVNGRVVEAQLSAPVQETFDGIEVNGDTASTGDAITMLHDSQAVGFGARAWKRRGWSETRWRTTVRALAAMQIVNEPQARQAIELVVPRGEAYARLARTVQK